MHRVSGKPHQIPIRRNSKSKISTVLRVSGSQSFGPKFEGKKPEEKKVPNSSILIPPIQQTEKNARPVRLASPADFREIKEYIPRSFSSPLPDERHSPELPNLKIHQSSDSSPKRINRNSQNRAISPPTKSISPRIQEQRIQEQKVDVRTNLNRGSITPPPGLDLSHMSTPKPIQTMRAGPPQFSNMLVQHCQTGILNLFAPNNYYEYRTRVPSNESFEHFMNRVFIGNFAIYRNYITIIREARGALLIRRAH